MTSLERSATVEPMATVAERAPLGTLLREWRQRRRLSQLELALEAGISARHLSFLETGRSRPSRGMVLHLAERLEVPLRDRNRLLLAAGYAHAYEERPLDTPELAPVREAIERVLAGHEPYPAVVVDRAWNLVAANRSVELFTALVDPALLEPPANVLRASLHPRGMAPHVLNLAEYRMHLLDRLRRQIALTADRGLAGLLEELEGYPAPEPDGEPDPAGEIALPLRLRVDGRELSFFGTIATFGTALDVTVAELSIEAFFPADAATAEALRR